MTLQKALNIMTICVPPLPSLTTLYISFQEFFKISVANDISSGVFHVFSLVKPLPVSFLRALNVTSTGATLVWNITDTLYIGLGMIQYHVSYRDQYGESFNDVITSWCLFINELNN